MESKNKSLNEEGMEKLGNFFSWASVSNPGGKIPVSTPFPSYLQHVHLSSAEGDHSGFAVLGSLLPVPMPAAHSCQHCLL